MEQYLIEMIKLSASLINSEKIQGSARKDAEEILERCMYTLNSKTKERLLEAQGIEIVKPN